MDAPIDRQRDVLMTFLRVVNTGILFFKWHFIMLKNVLHNKTKYIIAFVSNFCLDFPGLILELRFLNAIVSHNHGIFILVDF